VAAVSWQNQRTLTDRDPATGEPIRWRALGQKRDVARDVAAHGQFPVKAVAETLGTLDLVERLARHAKSNHRTGRTRTALLR